MFGDSVLEPDVVLRKLRNGSEVDTQAVVPGCRVLADGPTRLSGDVLGCGVPQRGGAKEQRTGGSDDEAFFRMAGAELVGPVRVEAGGMHEMRTRHDPNRAVGFGHVVEAPHGDKAVGVEVVGHQGADVLVEGLFPTTGSGVAELQPAFEDEPRLENMSGGGEGHRV